MKISRWLPLIAGFGCLALLPMSFGQVGKAGDKAGKDKGEPADVHPAMKQLMDQIIRNISGPPPGYEGLTDKERLKVFDLTISAIQTAMDLVGEKSLIFQRCQKGEARSRELMMKWQNRLTDRNASSEEKEKWALLCGRLKECLRITEDNNNSLARMRDRYRDLKIQVTKDREFYIVALDMSDTDAQNVVVKKTVELRNKVEGEIDALRKMSHDGGVQLPNESRNR